MFSFVKSLSRGGGREGGRGGAHGEETELRERERGRERERERERERARARERDRVLRITAGDAALALVNSRNSAVEDLRGVSPSDKTKVSEQLSSEPPGVATPTAFPSTRPRDTRAPDAPTPALAPLAHIPAPALPVSLPPSSSLTSPSPASFGCGVSPSMPPSPTCSRPALESMRRPSCHRI